MNGNSRLLEIILDVRNHCEMQGKELLRQATEIASFQEFAKILVGNLHTALYRDGSQVRHWFEDLQWVYAGLHINASSFSLYGDRPNERGLVEAGRFSFTFDPRNGRIDKNESYFGKGINFTTFLWPEDRDVRNLITAPLEIIFFEEFEYADFRERLDSRNAIFVPKEVRNTIAENLDKDASLYHAVLETRQGAGVLRQTVKYLNQNYCCAKPNGLLEQALNDYIITEASEEVCLSMLSNTIQLHLKLGIDPRTVIFMPVSFLGERQGVICYVLDSVLSDDDFLALEVLSDYVLLASRRPDYEIASVLTRQAATIMRMQSSLMFLHEAERQIGNACQSSKCIEKATENLKTIESPVGRCFEGLLYESDYIYTELQRLRSSLISFTDEILGRSQLHFQRLQIGEVIESSISHLKMIEGQNFVSGIAVDWDNSNAEVRAVPNLLSASIANFIRDGIQEARKRMRVKTEEPVDVEVRFERCDDRVAVIIKDSGYGQPPEVIADILSRMEIFEPSHPRNENGAGYALTSGHSIIRSLHQGFIDASSEEGCGVEWRISIPTVTVGEESGDVS